jgi:hypothetical protein
MPGMPKRQQALTVVHSQQLSSVPGLSLQPSYVLWLSTEACKLSEIAIVPMATGLITSLISLKANEDFQHGAFPNIMLHPIIIIK